MLSYTQPAVGPHLPPREVRRKLLEFEDGKNRINIPPGTHTMRSDGTERASVFDITEFKYRPLPTDKKRIRLLRLLPGVLDSPQIDCEMFEAEFDGDGKLRRLPAAEEKQRTNAMMEVKRQSNGAQKVDTLDVEVEKEGNGNSKIITYDFTPYGDNDTFREKWRNGKLKRQLDRAIRKMENNGKNRPGTPEDSDEEELSEEGWSDGESSKYTRAKTEATEDETFEDTSHKRASSWSKLTQPHAGQTAFTRGAHAAVGHSSEPELHLRGGGATEDAEKDPQSQALHGVASSTALGIAPREQSDTAQAGMAESGSKITVSGPAPHSDWPSDDARAVGTEPTLEDLGSMGQRRYVSSAELSLLERFKPGADHLETLLEDPKDSQAPILQLEEEGERSHNEWSVLQRESILIKDSTEADLSVYQQQSELGLHDEAFPLRHAEPGGQLPMEGVDDDARPGNKPEDQAMPQGTLRSRTFPFATAEDKAPPKRKEADPPSAQKTANSQGQDSRTALGEPPPDAGTGIQKPLHRISATVTWPHTKAEDTAPQKKIPLKRRSTDLSHLMEEHRPAESKVDDLPEIVEYEALSWRWGDEERGQFAIMIKKDGVLYKMRVSETLGLALKYLRSGRDRILWLDAICINQKDFLERSAQVAMMSLVYSSAKQVCVWLGEDNEESTRAIQFIKNEITTLKNFDKLCTDKTHGDDWRALLVLMQREWFSRRWVVQEIALARKATVYCGPDEIPWRELAIAVELFVEVETATHRLSELMKKTDKFNLVPNWFEHISELGASLLVGATARIFRGFDSPPLLDHISEKRKKEREERIRRESLEAFPGRSLLGLEYLVTSLSIFDCGRPHDSVYALVAIARDASPFPPASLSDITKESLIGEIFTKVLEQKPYPLDYTAEYPDVCKDFVEFCILQCAKSDPLQALDILCRPWAKDWRPTDWSPFKVEEETKKPDKTRFVKVPEIDSFWVSRTAEQLPKPVLSSRTGLGSYKRHPSYRSNSFIPRGTSGTATWIGRHSAAPHGQDEAIEQKYEQRFPKGNQRFFAAGHGLICGLRAMFQSVQEQIRQKDFSGLIPSDERLLDAREGIRRGEVKDLSLFKAPTVGRLDIEQLAATLYEWSLYYDYPMRLGYILPNGSPWHVSLPPGGVAEETVWISVDNEVSVVEPAQSLHLEFCRFSAIRPVAFSDPSHVSASRGGRPAPRPLVRLPDPQIRQTEAEATPSQIAKLASESTMLYGDVRDMDNYFDDIRMHWGRQQEDQPEMFWTCKIPVEWLPSQPSKAYFRRLAEYRDLVKRGEAVVDEWLAARLPREGELVGQRWQLKLPSWVARITDAPFDIFPHPGVDMVKMGRKNAEPLVGQPQDRHRNYSAGQSKHVELSKLKFRRRPRARHYSLYVSGFRFDRVDKVAQVSQAGAIPVSWLDLAGWPNATRPYRPGTDPNDPPGQFWRTLVADRGKHDSNPPYYYARACKETILKGGMRSNAVDTTALIFNERNSIIAEFCRRVQSVIWNRALIRTRKGALGLAPPGVREGDYICIIYGCTVPVVLRRRTQPKTQEVKVKEELEDHLEAFERALAKTVKGRIRKARYQNSSPEWKEEIERRTQLFNGSKKPKTYHWKRTVELRAAAIPPTQRELELAEAADAADERPIEMDHYPSGIDKETLKYETTDDSDSELDDDEMEDEYSHERQPPPRKKSAEAVGSNSTQGKRRQERANLVDPYWSYQFVGQAYVHGAMDGEAVRQKFYKNKPDHVFELR
jgi:hypothetical protein